MEMINNNKNHEKTLESFTDKEIALEEGRLYNLCHPSKSDINTKQFQQKPKLSQRIYHKLCEIAKLEEEKK